MSALVAQKACFKCGFVRPRGDFYGHPRMADRLLGKCKSCARRDARRNRAARSDYYREYDRLRYERDGGRGDPGHIAARAELKKAVRRGDIERPSACAECGGGGRIEGHHEDYDRPLDVVWLCSRCHGRRHRS